MSAQDTRFRPRRGRAPVDGQSSSGQIPMRGFAQLPPGGSRQFDQGSLYGSAGSNYDGRQNLDQPSSGPQGPGPGYYSVQQSHMHRQGRPRGGNTLEQSAGSSRSGAQYGQPFGQQTFNGSQSHNGYMPAMQTSLVPFQPQSTARTQAPPGSMFPSNQPSQPAFTSSGGPLYSAQFPPNQSGQLVRYNPSSQNRSSQPPQIGENPWAPEQQMAGRTTYCQERQLVVMEGGFGDQTSQQRWGLKCEHRRTVVAPQSAPPESEGSEEDQADNSDDGNDDSDDSGDSEPETRQPERGTETKPGFKNSGIVTGRGHEMHYKPHSNDGFYVRSAGH